jgi:2-polyprenyl-3-methyl-5-hydroxy-6-metoxy-1,4-benzoquinol methylase
MSQIRKTLYEGKEFIIRQEDTQLVAITKQTGTEYSRLDMKTKKAIHWYARKICDRIYYRFPEKDKPLNICCLGSAMGAIPLELLENYPNAEITCVDIDYESLYILEHSILKPYGQRVVYEEMNAKHFVKELDTAEFDIIINDLFSEQTTPPFVHTSSFLRDIFRGLKHRGLYFANTITNTFEFTHGIAIEKLGYEIERFTKKPIGLTNIVYEVIKE